MPGPVYPATKPGQFYRMCARTGQKVLASKTSREWTGQYVRTKSFEERHPQDFLQARRDDPSVHDPRPEGDDNFLTAAQNTREAL